MTPSGAPARPPTTASARAHRAALRRDAAQLQHLIDILQRHMPQEPIDDRDLRLLAGTVTAGTAEQHLRAVSALLLTLQTYLRGRRQPRTAGTRRRVAAPAPSPRPAPPSTAAGNGGGAAPAPALAAAAARYIARDLAARQLSEFTSAEGYRLARALARLGGAEDAVEDLLTEANRITLHPMPLSDAVSHSPR